MPVTEIIIFDTSEAFRKDPALLFPAFDIAMKADGAQPPSYYGFQIENSGSTAYLFFNWDSFESHKALIDAPIYPELIRLLTPCLMEGGKSEMLHVEFSAPTTALHQPVTEVTVLTLKAPENRADVVGILTEFSELTGKSLVFGQAREDENKYVVVCGWKSLEDHAQTAKKEEVSAAIEKLALLVKREHLFHTTLAQYRSS